MGFSLRKRTKGKDSWLNGSLSRKGAHASASTKFGKDVTYNKSGRGSRVTINLGNGLRYIKSSSRRKTKETEETPYTWREIARYIITRVLFFGGIYLLGVALAWIYHLI